MRSYEKWEGVMSTNDPLSGTGGEFIKHMESATDAAQGYNPSEVGIDKQQFNFPSKAHGAPTDAPGGQPPADPGSTVEGAQPHMNPGSTVEGAQPHMDGGA